MQFPPSVGLADLTRSTARNVDRIALGQGSATKFADQACTVDGFASGDLLQGGLELDELLRRKAERLASFRNENCHGRALFGHLTLDFDTALDDLSGCDSHSHEASAAPHPGRL